MNTYTKHAVYAAQHRKQWGRHAALRYIQRKGVPVGLYRLACQLEATKNVEAL